MNNYYIHDSDLIVTGAIEIGVPATESFHAVTLQQLDDAIGGSGYLPLTGGTLTGDLTIEGALTVENTTTLTNDLTVEGDTQLGSGDDYFSIENGDAPVLKFVKNGTDRYRIGTYIGNDSFYLYDTTNSSSVIEYNYTDMTLILNKEVFLNADMVGSTSNILLTGGGTIATGIGSGSLGLTINDSEGNTNLTFNHIDGIPDQNGHAGRIRLNTDNNTIDSVRMKFEVASNVVSGVAVDTIEKMEINNDGVKITGNLEVAGDGATTYGPNSGWGANLRIGGNGHTASGVMASIATTDGNLHIDAAPSKDLIMNLYEGDEFKVYNGAGTENFKVFNNGNGYFRGGLTCDSVAFTTGSISKINSGYYAGSGSSRTVAHGLATTPKSASIITQSSGPYSAIISSLDSTNIVFRVIRSETGDTDTLTRNAWWIAYKD